MILIVNYKISYQITSIDIFPKCMGLGMHACVSIPKHK